MLKKKPQLTHTILEHIDKFNLKKDESTEIVQALTTQKNRTKNIQTLTKSEQERYEKLKRMKMLFGELSPKLEEEYQKLEEKKGEQEYQGLETFYNEKGEEILRGHTAFNDSPENNESLREDVRLYKIGDDYVPHSNECDDVELLNKINNSNEEELEKMYLKNNTDNLSRRKSFYKDNHEKYVERLKEMLRKHIDIMKMYQNGDRFKIVKRTYNDKENLTGIGEISCRYVHIRSEKTGKIYRVLSI